MIKLAYGSKKKIVKLQKHEFNVLRGLIKQSFPDVPADYILSYLDQDKDEISLGSDEDLHIMLASPVKIHHIYIKQSLSQMIEITDRIEPSFQIYDSSIRKASTDIQAQIKEDFLKKEEKQTEIATSEKLIEQMKTIQFQVPINVVKEDKQEVQVKKEQEKKEKQDIIDTQLIKQPVVSVDEMFKQFGKEEQVVLSKIEEAPKNEPKQEEEPEPSQNSKSFIISVSDSNRTEIDEAVLHEKIEDMVKKIIEKDKDQKSKIIPKKEQVIENKQILEEKVKRAKIFEERNFQKKQHFEAQLIYHGVICSNCKDEYGIIGSRYQCIYCEGFNLCQQCESVVVHEHALLKVRLPQQVFNKDQLINKYRHEIFSKALPPGHYVPSISKEEANRFIQTSKLMLNESMERAQRMINDMYLKMEMSHKNPYEQHRPIVPPKPVVEPLKERMDHLISLFGVDGKEAKYFCQIYPLANKEKLADIYLQRKTGNSL